MEINIGEAMGLVELRVPTDSPFAENSSPVQTYAIPYEIPAVTPPDHVHCMRVDVIAELEMLYGMTAEEALEYAILMRVHTLTAGFDPEEDWDRFYRDTAAGRLELAMRELQITDKFRGASMETSLVVPLVEGQEADALATVRACVGCGNDRPGIPSGESGKLAHAALDSYFAARGDAAKLPARYLTEHTINKRAGGWERVREVFSGTESMREHAQQQIFDLLIGTPVMSTIRDRAERAGFSNSERST